MEEQASGGTALPWIDLEAFCQRALRLAEQDYGRIRREGGWAFLDRSVVDAAAALQSLTGSSGMDHATSCPYHRHVFFTPPWPAIYVQDDARRHDLDAAVQEYDRLVRAYEDLGYEIRLLPFDDVATRADFILNQLGAAG